MARDSARVLPAPHGHHPAGHPLLRGAVEAETVARPARPQEPLRDVRTWTQEAAELRGAEPVGSGDVRFGHLFQAMFNKSPDEIPAAPP